MLDIDMEFFLEKYFEKMVGMARKYGVEKAEMLVERLWRATEAMIQDKDPQKTNLQVFEENFFHDYHHPQEMMRPFFEQFYASGFRELQGHCQPFPQIRSMMEKVFNRGYRVVIATNPVFPLNALEQRLCWAEVGDFPYELITSYEVMHYTKPHTEYYEEVLEFLGLNPEDCIMVGNDVGEDLTAREAGIKTFLLKERLLNPHDLPITADWEGYLPDLVQFIDELPYSGGE